MRIDTYVETNDSSNWKIATSISYFQKIYYNGVIDVKILSRMKEMSKRVHYVLFSEGKASFWLKQKAWNSLILESVHQTRWWFKLEIFTESFVAHLQFFNEINGYEINECPVWPKNVFNQVFKIEV